MNLKNELIKLSSLGYKIKGIGENDGAAFGSIAVNGKKYSIKLFPVGSQYGYSIEDEGGRKVAGESGIPAESGSYNGQPGGLAGIIKFEINRLSKKNLSEEGSFFNY